jgi:hypothetical protein
MLTQATNTIGKYKSGNIFVARPDTARKRYSLRLFAGEKIAFLTKNLKKKLNCKKK